MKAYKYKLRLTPAQEAAIEASLELQRCLYNDALRERRDLLAESKKTSFADQRKSIVTARRQADPRAAAENYGVCGGTLRRLDEAWQMFERRWRALSIGDKGVRPDEAGMPHFVRYGEFRTLTWDAGGPKYRPANPDAAPGEPKNHQVYLPPYGWVRMHKDRPIPEGSVIRTGVEVTRTPTGWYVMLPVMDAALAEAQLAATRDLREENRAKREADAAEAERLAALGIEPAPKPKAAPKPKRTPAEIEAEKWRDVVEALGGAEKAAAAAAAAGGHIYGLAVGVVDSPFAVRDDGQKWTLPAFGDLAAGAYAEAQRDVIRRRELSRERALPRIAEIERDASLTDEERDRMIRRARREVSRGTHSAQERVARISQHVANQRKREHYRIAHQALTGIPAGSLLVVSAIEPRKAVKVKAARPDAESPAFLPNGQKRRRERNRSVMGAAPASFLLLLEQEAAEAGIVVVRVPMPSIVPDAALAVAGTGFKAYSGEIRQVADGSGLTIRADMYAARALREAGRSSLQATLQASS